ncbi:MAG: beta-galactosidase, partial [Mameliella sp.]|nr:beta-galactosidase [Phaeodactylibacter sp.]
LGFPLILSAQQTADQAIPADKIYYGASYYPETWPRASVAEDIKHMKELSMNVVRMAEFSWSKMEPNEGEYDFEWLKSIMDELHENGISAILGTPTATPPVWLWEKHPEIGQLDENGHRKYHGARKSYDYNNQVYQHYVVRIVTEMAKALGNHPALLGWQTDNELSMKPDFSTSTKVLFQNWLREKYGTIENLNQIWATDLWSQTYQRFDQIPLPRSWTWHHPSLQLEWKRFQSESVVNFQAIQLEVIRKYSDRPITHDSMPGQSTNYEDLFEDLDYMAVNNYHSFEAYDRVLSNYDRMRGFKKGMHWLFETAPNNSGGGKKGNTWFLHKPDGSLHAALWMNYALGGQGAIFWLWRQHRAGQEMPHGSIINAWGKPVANYDDLKKLGADLQKSSDFLLNAPVTPAEIGIFYDHECDMGLRIEQYANDIRYYTDWSYRFYLALQDQHLHRDVLMPGADISDYKVLYMPLMPMISTDLRKRLKTWVENGGTLLVGPMSGYRTEEWASFTDYAMGDIEEWSGIEVDSRIPIGTKQRPAETPVEMAYTDVIELPEGTASLWSEALSSKEGKVIATYTNGMHADEAAIIENTVGKGKVVIFGTDPGRTHLGKLLSHYAAAQGIQPLATGDQGPLVVARKGAQQEGFIVDNIMTTEKTVTLPKGKYTDILTGEAFGSTQTLKPFEVRVLKKK